MTLSTFNQ